MLRHYLLDERLLPLCHSISSTAELSKKNGPHSSFGINSPAVTQGGVKGLKGVWPEGQGWGEFSLLKSLAAGTVVVGTGNVRVQSTDPALDEQPLPIKPSLQYVPTCLDFSKTQHYEPGPSCLSPAAAARR